MKICANRWTKEHLSQSLKKPTKAEDFSVQKNHIYELTINNNKNNAEKLFEITLKNLTFYGAFVNGYKFEKNITSLKQLIKFSNKNEKIDKKERVLEKSQEFINYNKKYDYSKRTAILKKLIQEIKTLDNLKKYHQQLKNLENLWKQSKPADILKAQNVDNLNEPTIFSDEKSTIIKNIQLPTPIKIQGKPRGVLDTFVRKRKTHDYININDKNKKRKEM